MSDASSGPELNAPGSARAKTDEAGRPSPPKIAFEEHFRACQQKVHYPSPRVEREIAPKLSLDEIPGRLEMMDEHGIEMQILSHTADGAQEISDLDRVRSFNDDAMAVVQKHPDRFRALAALPLWDPELANEEMDRCLAHTEFVGVISNGYQEAGDEQHWYDTPEYLTFWKHLEDSGAPIYLHPRVAGPDKFTTDYPELAASCMMFHTGVFQQVLRLLVCGIFDHCSGIKMILGHMGEFLPWWIWRFDHRYEISGWGDYSTSAQKARRKSFGFVKESTLDQVMHRNIWITTSGMFSDPHLKFSIDLLGSDRILFATDYPYDDMTKTVHWFDNLTIDDQDKLKIARGNACSIIPGLLVE